MHSWQLPWPNAREGVLPIHKDKSLIRKKRKDIWIFWTSKWVWSMFSQFSIGSTQTSEKLLSKSEMSFWWQSRTRKKKLITLWASVICHKHTLLRDKKDLQRANIGCGITGRSRYRKIFSFQMTYKICWNI